ncbi:hypothetical protein K1719_004506 [Acacia pycnantha]|nr:hypothetical protein K1719_004506 [Acacia pycnantha]
MIIILAETKCEDDDRFEDLKRMGYDGLVVVPSVGCSGGLMVVWRSDLIVVTELWQAQQLIHLHCVLNGRCAFFLTAIYAIPRPDLKRILWEELMHIASSTQEPWMTIGDFNDIASLSERTGGAGSDEARIRRFNDILYGCRLMDLGYVGPKYTWWGPCLRHGARLYERLDRAVANEAFIGAFPDCAIKGSCMVVVEVANQLIFESNFVKPLNPASTVLHVWRKYSTSSGLSSGGANVNELGMSQWEKPDVGWWKMNVDGAVSMHSLKAGCGGVLRDAQGSWVVGFSK